MRRQIAARIARRGTKATVLELTETGTDGFNNPEHEYVEDRTVTTLQTYPNRNTEVEDGGGTYSRDSPVFFFSRLASAPEPPGEADRIRYNGTVYELEAPTTYDTHIEIFGTKVS